ncbi:hypothetical protein D3C87_926370 [compost metagenome]
MPLELGERYARLSPWDKVVAPPSGGRKAVGKGGSQGAVDPALELYREEVSRRQV